MKIIDNDYCLRVQAHITKKTEKEAENVHAIWNFQP